MTTVINNEQVEAALADIRGASDVLSECAKQLRLLNGSAHAALAHNRAQIITQALATLTAALAAREGES